jgi:hypothetical protein
LLLVDEIADKGHEKFSAIRADGALRFAEIEMAAGVDQFGASVMARPRVMDAGPLLDCTK